MVANGVVKVDGNRKSVQHLDGGIVKELRVKEGDRVKAESRTAFSLAHFRADSPGLAVAHQRSPAQGGATSSMNIC